MGLEAPFFSALKGKTVSSIWNGYGSTLFVEFGDLGTVRHKGRKISQSSGELTLMIEWSWRIERPRSILGGSFSSKKRWPGMFQKLIGAHVAEAELFGAIPEILVWLSNGHRIASFSTVEGQPEWALLTKTPKLGSLYVKKGALAVEQPGS